MAASGSLVRQMTRLACLSGLTAARCPRRLLLKAGCRAVAGAPPGAVNVTHLPLGLLPGDVPFSSRSPDYWADWSYETTFRQASRPAGWPAGISGRRSPYGHRACACGTQAGTIRSTPRARRSRDNSIRCSSERPSRSSLVTTSWSLPRLANGNGRSSSGGCVTLPRIRHAIDSRPVATGRSAGRAEAGRKLQQGRN